MKDNTIKALMVPISEYATVSEGSTLCDAIQMLEKAQKDFENNRYTHRAVLILDKDKQVIGKLSQMDVLRALEPKHMDLNRINKLEQHGFSQKFVWSLRIKKQLQEATLKGLCAIAAQQKVEDFMQAPTEGEYVDQDALLDAAVQQLVLGNHFALLVTAGKKIVGILRLTDVFAAVSQTIQDCQNQISEGENG